MKSTNPKFLISLNLHKDTHFEDQLRNIQEHLKFDYTIVLNCNNKMYDLLKNKKYENVLINPVTIEKKRFHGSIFQGIFENLKFANTDIEYDYVIVLSARSFFFKKLDYDCVGLFYENSKCYNLRSIDFTPKTKLEKEGWPKTMWQNFINSDFYLFLQNNKFNFKKEMHEGMLLTKKNCEDIISFFDKNKDLYESIINTNNPVEEYVIQSLLLNWQNFTTCIGVWPTCESNPYFKDKSFVRKRY
tara:strand:- start:474 stop:1205 length:732 start_codon:yes stop_codon:yes gene_type:complete